MIRMLIPLVVVFLAYLLIRTFLERPQEPPIDIDPIDASSESANAAEPRGASSAGSREGDSQAKAHATQDDDIIDVEPV